MNQKNRIDSVNICNPYELTIKELNLIFLKKIEQNLKLFINIYRGMP